MLCGFFDESGHHGDDGQLIQFTFGGCIADVAAWKTFEKDWTDFLNRHALGWFHATDFADLAKHRTKLEEATEIIRNNRLSCYGSTMFIPDEHRPDKAKKALQKFYEDTAIDMIWNAARHAEAVNDDIDLVFARHGDFSFDGIKKHFSDFQSVHQRLRSVNTGPEILAKRIDVLSPRMIRIIEDLSGDWRHVDERIEHVTEEIEVLALGSESCRQLMTVPGIGPLIASAMVAAIANGAAFAKGRDFAAWLGLVPKQMSTGDRTILGRISKRGNRYLRMLFMQGARVILLRPANWAKHSFGPWLTAAAKRLHHNVLATALANKLARIAWTVLAQRRNYEARVIADAA